MREAKVSTSPSSSPRPPVRPRRIIKRFHQEYAAGSIASNPASPRATPEEGLEEREELTSVRVRVAQPLHLLLGLQQQRRHGTGVPDISVALERDADLDGTVAPEVSSDIPVGGGVQGSQSKKVSIAPRAAGGGGGAAMRRGRGALPVLGSLQSTAVEVLKTVNEVSTVVLSRHHEERRSHLNVALVGDRLRACRQRKQRQLAIAWPPDQQQDREHSQRVTRQE